MSGFRGGRGDTPVVSLIRAPNVTILLRPRYPVPLSRLFVVKLKAPWSPPT